MPNSLALELVPFLWDALKITGGGVVAAMITLTVSGRRQDRDLKRTETSLAIQLVDHFERYALACAKVPAENAEGGRGRHDPNDFTGLSRLPDLPDPPKDEAGWRALAPDLAIDCRTFSNKVDLARDMVRGDGDAYADDVEAELNKQAMILGLAAWRLAARIRQRFTLGQGDPGWDLETDLQGRLNVMLANEERYWAANRQMIAAMPAVEPKATEQTT